MGTDLRLTVMQTTSDDGETGGCQFCDRHRTITGREMPVTTPHPVYLVESPRKAGVSSRAVICKGCFVDLVAGVANYLP